MAIIDVNHQTPLINQTILISRNSIVAIFTADEKSIPDSFTVISMKGKYLLPGLIGAHVHMETDPSGTDNRQHPLEVLQKMLFSGVTSVRDMAGDARVLASLARDAATGYPRTTASTKGGIAGKMPYMLSVTDSTNLTFAIAETKDGGATGIKLYRFLSAPLVNKIVAAAKKQGMLVWAHASLDGAKPSDLVTAGTVVISHALLMLYDKMDSIPLSWKKQFIVIIFGTMPSLTCRSCSG